MLTSNNPRVIAINVIRFKGKKKAGTEKIDIDTISDFI